MTPRLSVFFCESIRFLDFFHLRLKCGVKPADSMSMLLNSLYFRLYVVFVMLITLGCSVNQEVEGQADLKSSDPVATLSLFDTDTSSTTLSNSQVVSINILTSNQVSKYCLSETQVTRPSSSSATCNGGQGSEQGWSTAPPTTFSLSSNSGVKTVYLWIFDKEGKGNSEPISAQIHLDLDIDADNIAPTLTVSSQPSAVDNTSDFSFSADDGAGSGIDKIECQTDGGGYSTCTSPLSLSGLSQGAHSLDIRAVDLAGNFSSVSSINWTLDSLVPTLTVSSQPSAVDNTSDFSFSADDGAGSGIDKIECQTDGGGYSTCTSPLSLSGLSQGAHSLDIRAVDLAGNFSSVSSINWTLDSLVPTLTVSSQPSAVDNTSDFSFSADDGAGSGIDKIECQTDGGGYSTCTSPLSLSGLSQGAHSLDIRAVDLAGNFSSVSSINWTLDSLVPTLTVSSQPSAVDNTSDFSFSADDGAGSGIDKIECQTDGGGYSTCTSPLSLSGLSQGAHSLDIRAVDLAGNASSVSSINWTLDSIDPIITLDQSAWINKNNDVTFTGSCETGIDVGVSGGDTNTTSCSGGTFSYQVSTQSSDSTRSYTFTQTDSAGNEGSVVGQWTRDTQAPTLTPSTMVINDGSGSTGNNSIQVDLQGNDSATNITAFCLKWVNSTAPGESDSCWVLVNAPSPGLTPGLNLTLVDFDFLIGFGVSNYTVYAWLKDEAGNISSLTAAGSGTLGQDKQTTFYDPGTPPTVIDIIATNSATPADPPSVADRSIPLGNDVHIKWNASDVQGLASNPISLYYTSDEVTMVPITSGLNNGSNSGCTVDEAGTSADDTATGCYVWTGGSPTNSYFRVMVRAVDTDNLVGGSTSTFLNVSEVQVLGGNPDPGVNSSAKSAMFFNHLTGGEDYSDPGTLVVRPNGEIFFRDARRGILRVDPSTGTQEVFVPYTGVASGDGGLHSAATLRLPYRISLDYQEGLLIFDYDRIRRVDLNTGTINTIIGGGALTNDGVAPTNVQITRPSATGLVTHASRGMPFFALPNGDIYFQSEGYGGSTENGNRFRVFDASLNQVNSFVPSGTGDNHNPAQDISKCWLHNFGVSFDPPTSEITSITLVTRHYSGYSGCDDANIYTNLNVNPQTGVSEGPHPTEPGHYAVDYRSQGRDGHLYYVDRNGYIKKYDPSTRLWSAIVGTGGVGHCADGTPALSCDIDPQDVFVSALGQIYFMDKGLIRTVDQSGNVLTLMGQSYSFGDGGKALSSRMNLVNGAQYWNDGGTEKIVLLDQQEYRIREFEIGGNIQTIAGNGSNAQPNTSSPANTQGLQLAVSGTYWDFFALDTSDGSVFMSRGSSWLVSLNRSTGKWQDIVGGGATYYHDPTAHGQVGSNLRFSTYPPMVLGFDGTNVLATISSYDSGLKKRTHSFVNSYAKTDGTQTHVLGVQGVSASYEYCADSTPLASCDAAAASPSYVVSNAAYDSFDNKWIIKAKNYPALRLVSAGGTMSTLATPPRDASSIAYRRDAGKTVDILYYCSDGALYKYDLNGGPTETLLTWVVPGFECTGRTLEYNSSRNSLIFPYKFNGLSGVAEYLNP